MTEDEERKGEEEQVAGKELPEFVEVPNGGAGGGEGEEADRHEGEVIRADDGAGEARVLLGGGWGAEECQGGVEGKERKERTERSGRWWAMERS